MTDVLDWLLDSDPAIRWQVLRDLTDAQAEEVAAERSRVATTGWGRQLLDLQRDGTWAGGACFPGPGWQAPRPVLGDPDGQPWVATLPTLRLLRDCGIDPADPTVRAAVAAVREHTRWEYDDLAFFDGEVEPCINGGTVALGAYFGVPVDGVVERLLTEQLQDGGWNCEAERGSVRSSYHSTICVLDGLAEYHRGGSALDVTEALRRGEEYLLDRHLCRRLSTGEVADPSFLQFSFPTQWHYDVLWALDYFRARGAAPDPRLAEAVALVRSKQRTDGFWTLDHTHPGLVHLVMEGEGQPSRWITLRALRVLRWADTGSRGA
ncbi:hypothetical protein [Arsenicicoccus sp. oral taxon 190]|uniref:hypothetical protein n=1 Tax=Arsenicicoccus sp. oral taxon 190 TaxID=1658671 RepID=UPI00067A253C|nr:hypothetical protein [Arsenicicoccus sp. oral taxon 190]AKT51652.1 hypothetical protein ADJ73_10785 [Arsenicicoccus sp. oral taxon 190]